MSHRGNAIPVTTPPWQWWAYRVGVPAAVGGFFVALAIGLAIAINSGPLAQKTVTSPRGEVIDFRMWNSDGDVYVLAAERGSGLRQGWSTMRLLSDAESLGTVDAEIFVDEQAQRVMFRAGKGSITFDLASNSFGAPVVAP